jgi:glycosyltransferase involved in cell wall biosynthesis
VATLSVVTITFNDPEGLKRTFESLDLHSVEWIVVDASNIPAVQEHNRDLLDAQNVHLIQEPDNGRFDAMNKGLRVANGDVVCLLNGGDTFENQEVPNLVIESFKEEGWVWAVGETKAVDATGRFLWNWPMPSHNSLKLIFGINSYCHQATFVKLHVLADLGFFEIESLYSDWVVSLLLSRKSRPHLLGFQTTNFLADGISSQQTIDYWKTESVRLRRKYKVEFLGIPVLDSFLQWGAAKFIATTRGQLIRSDLIEKHS